MENKVEIKEKLEELYHKYKKNKNKLNKEQTVNAAILLKELAVSEETTYAAKQLARFTEGVSREFFSVLTADGSVSDEVVYEMLDLIIEVYQKENNQQNKNNMLGKFLAAAESILKNNREIYQNLPASMRIWREVSGEEKCPVNISQGHVFLANYSKTHKLNKLYPEDKNLSDDSAIELKNLRFRYSKDGSDVIKDLSLSVKKGSFYAIVGGNGAGKSTLLTLINGVNRPYSGKVTVNARNTAYLPQNPALILTGKTVLKSLYDTFIGSDIDKDEQNKLIGKAVSVLGLESLINRHPFDLSGGEVQRAAIAKLLLLNPQILLLDEPTKGLDARNKIKFAKIIKSLKSSGVTVVMVTHDIEFCAKYADTCSMLFNGEITSTGTPREFFSENSFYVTSSSKISRGIIDNAVTAEEVIFCCTGKREEDKPDDSESFFIGNQEVEIKEKSKPKMPLYKKITAVIGALLLIFGILFNVDALGFIRPKDFNFVVNFLFIAVPSVILMFSFSSLTKAKDRAGERKDSKLPKRTIAAAVMILLLIPLTIFIGTTYLDDQKYLFISLLVLFECMVPFFLVFEGRKPQARELVIIAVLCAIAIAGRTLFIALPQVKPVLAIVIISGVAFGGETGFIVGASVWQACCSKRGFCTKAEAFCACSGLL